MQTFHDLVHREGVAKFEVVEVPSSQSFAFPDQRTTISKCVLKPPVHRAKVVFVSFPG